MTKPASKFVAVAILFAAGALLAMTDRAAGETRFRISIGATAGRRAVPVATHRGVVRREQERGHEKACRDKCDKDHRAGKRGPRKPKVCRPGSRDHRDCCGQRTRRPRLGRGRLLPRHRRVQFVRPYRGHPRVLVVSPSRMWTMWTSTRPLFSFEWHN